MRRPSVVLERVVSGIDDLGGLCASRESNDPEYEDSLTINQIFYGSLDSVLSAVAHGVELLWLRPVAYVENLLLKEQRKPRLVFNYDNY